MNVLAILSLIFDSGILVLIWLVQLVIYPSFRFFNSTDLKIWHTKYTKRITIIVLPLMLGQLLCSGYGLFDGLNHLNSLKLALIISNWLLTFAIFVPLHNSIDTSNDLEGVTKKLEVRNWTRTLTWTLIFVISLKQFTP